MNRLRRMLFRLKLEIWYRWSKWKHRNTEIVIDPDIDFGEDIMYPDEDYDDWPW